MKSEAKTLPKATPAMAQRVWAGQQRPSARNVARALALGGRPAHYTTVARWKAQGWKPVKSDHPLAVVRSQLEAVAPLVSGDAETSLGDLIDDPVHNDFDELNDAEVLRREAREVAIATALVAKVIQKRATAVFNIAELTPALLSIAACLTALPSAFDQAISLDAADQRSKGFKTGRP
jgi:hypothetical protein